METIKYIFSIAGDIIDVIAAAILLYGFIKISVLYFSAEFIRHPFKTPLANLQKIRCEIGIYILLALDFLIASDIIHTILEINEKQLIQLAVMVILRTGIGFFLEREVRELHDN